MRIAVGQIWQETNTLNPCPTTREDFELFGVSRGAEMVSAMAHTNELGGFIQSLRQWADAPEIVGLARLPAWPGGLITTDAYEWIADEMATAVDRAMPVDGVLLALHGAMAADGYPDVEGSILHRFRQRIGDHVPLVVTLDLHANITPQMADSADAMVLYHCMPHVDIQDTGVRATGVLERITNSGARPVTAYQRIPVVLPAERANTEADNGFAVRRKQRLQELERMPHVMSAGVSVVQPWMDIPDLSSTVVVVTDNDETLAVDLCSELSRELWDTRQEYLGELESIEVAVQKAAECTAGLTVLGDAADATTSGAPGDSVWILQELLKYDWPNLAVVTIVAPEVVEQASLQGIGNQFHAELGGRRDTRFGTTISLDVEVKHLFDAEFTLSGHIGTNMPISMGKSAVLASNNVRIIATTRTGPHFAPELFQTAGIDPFSAAVIVAKSPCGFRAVYTARAHQIINVRAPGCAPSDFWTYPFEQIPRPLWPWDEIEHWSPQPQVFVSGAARS